MENNKVIIDISKNTQEKKTKKKYSKIMHDTMNSTKKKNKHTIIEKCISQKIEKI